MNQDILHGVKKPLQESLHLTSVSAFYEIIIKIMKSMSVKSFCEIGVEQLVFSKQIMSYCRENDIKYYCIDPSVTVEDEVKIREAGGHLIKKPSTKAISELPKIDLYLIDGDHNYYTVHKELLEIEKLSKSNDFLPLILLHDVSWPTDSRDAYYLPSYIPEEERHACSTIKGVDLNSKELCEGTGIPASDVYAWREQRGGEKNGVRCAVMDFLAASEELYEFVEIAGCYGLGILYGNKCVNEGQKIFLDHLQESAGLFYELLATLEYSRLDLFAHYINLIRKSDLFISARDEAIQAMEKMIQERDAYIKKLESGL